MPGADLLVDDDGRKTVVLSQSWLGTYIACPEQARQILTGEIPESSTPEADLGISVHEAIEKFITTGDLEYGHGHLKSLLSGYKVPDGHKWDTSKSQVADWNILDLAQDCLDEWHARYWVAGPKLREILLPKSEARFERVVYSSCPRCPSGICSAHRTPVPAFDIKLRGTVDFHSGANLWDWKFSARKWQQWETERYDIQSTLYTMGLFGVVLPFPEIKFNFAVVNPDGFAKSQIVTITRTQGHIDAMIDDVLVPVAHQIMSGTDHKWPALGHDWKCGEKWCGAWATCKGRHGLAW